MIIHILISVGFFLVILYLSVNLLGFLVRGLFVDPELDKLKRDSHEFIKHEIEKHERADMWINIIALIFLVVYFYALFHFWNIGVVLAAIVVMVGRLPELLWEIKHGERMTLANTKLLKKNVWYYISAFLPWTALPILYYSLYYF